MKASAYQFVRRLLPSFARPFPKNLKAKVVNANEERQRFAFMSPLLIKIDLSQTSWDQALKLVNVRYVHEIQHSLNKHLLHRDKGSQLLYLLLLESQNNPGDADLGSRGRAFNVEYPDLAQPQKQLLF